MLANLFRSIPCIAALAACGGSSTLPNDACVGHNCGITVDDNEGGQIDLEYIYLDTELQAKFNHPGPTVLRATAYFMSAETPDHNPLPMPGVCNNLETTKGWPYWVGTPHTDLDVGTVTLIGKNTAGADVMVDLPKQPAGIDAIGRRHDLFYQSLLPGAENYLKPESAYDVKFGGSSMMAATTIPGALYLAGGPTYTVNTPDLEGNGPLVAGTDFTVHWNPPETPANLPMGDQVLSVTWLVDTNGAPVMMCPMPASAGAMTIPGSAIADFKTVAAARGAATNKAILLRNAVVHQLVQLPNGEAGNKRRIDMLTLFCWAQLVDVQ